MKFGRIVQVNMHRLMLLDFWYVILSWWRQWRPPSARCCLCCSVCRLPASLLSACLQFLIHITFVLVDLLVVDWLYRLWCILSPRVILLLIAGVITVCWYVSYILLWVTSQLFIIYYYSTPSSIARLCCFVASVGRHALNVVSLICHLLT